jgi:site-specific DNA-methyltransferase (adenine-specific)
MRIEKVTDKITLYNCDCMEYMKDIPDKYFDLSIVDPPYGINRSGQRLTICKNKKHNRKYFENRGWDNKTPTKEYFDELFRVSKNQIIWGANYFVKYMMPKMGWIVWDKGQYGLSMSDGELAYSSFDKALRIITINRCELAKEGTIHPTQKPIKLYEWLLKNYAKPTDKILDTHFGSCSIGIACHNFGCSLDACEIDKEYFDKAVERLKMHVRQLDLFK